jgi:uncharacterized protein
MHVAQIWRYPIKSLAGTPMFSAEITPLGVERDREIVLVKNGRIADARRYPKLLGLHGGLDENDRPTIDGHPWDSPEAKKLVDEAVGASVELIEVDGPERFDVLPLLVATDGAIAELHEDGRRLRPNIVIGGVDGLTERTWPGRRIQIGDVVIEAAQLRQRCVMTTYDPDTQVQDINVLKRIVSDFDGTMALDCRVITPGMIKIGDEVKVLE